MLHWFEIPAHEKKHAEYLGMQWSSNYKCRKISSDHQNFDEVVRVFGKYEQSFETIRTRETIGDKHWHIVEKFISLSKETEKKWVFKKETCEHIQITVKIPTQYQSICLSVPNKDVCWVSKLKGAKLDIETGKIWIKSYFSNLRRFKRWLPLCYFKGRSDQRIALEKKNRDLSMKKLARKIFGKYDSNKVLRTKDQLDIMLGNYFASSRFIQ